VEFRTAAVVRCWLSVAIIASVYMYIFGSSLGDILYGLFLPVGVLVLASLIVTIYLASNKESR
jgi:hypothetical protein